MWMMGCNDSGESCLPTNNDSFSSCRKLRLLISRPPPNHNTNSPNQHHHHRQHSYGNPNHGRGARNLDHHGLFTLNHHHHLKTMAEQSKREFNMAHQVAVSSRWNPMPEQLRALEEMYRQGTRTPSADQIQQITSQLRRYGKIEGKNVFYWFQNHKARERQKHRRQMVSCGRAVEENAHLNSHRETGNLQCKESEATCKTASDDVQRANNKKTPNDNSNNSYNWEAAEVSNIDEVGKSAMSGGGGGGGGGGGSASASSSATAVKATSTSSASSTAVVSSLWMKSSDTKEFLLPNSNLIITGSSMTNYDNLGRNAICPLPPPHPVVLPTSTTAGHSIFTALHTSSPLLPFPSKDFQTLQLFPLRSEEYEEDQVCYAGEDDHLRRQFFEFLPMKN